MRTVVTWTCVILCLSLCGLAVPQDLPPEIPADQSLLESTRVVADAQPSAPEGPAEEAAPEPAETDTADEEQGDSVSVGDWLLGLGSAVMVLVELLF